MGHKGRKRRTGDIDGYVSRIEEASARARKDFEQLPLRKQIERVVELLGSVRDLGVSTAIAHGYHPTSGLHRIMQYLIEHAGIVIPGPELEAISGISEYGRRVRQLRVEDGYRVFTGASPDPESGIDLRPSEYLLTSKEPDEDVARRWKIANAIRRRKGIGSQAKILEFLKENVGRVVTTEDLSYVSNDKKEFGRRTRELRTEEGYPIATRFTGRPDLRSGEYVLLSTERIAEAHDRHIPHEIQKRVYQRDKNTCRLCGWSIDSWTQDDPRILELHHVEHHRERGPNTAENLVTVCSRCHDRIHAGTLRVPPALLDEIAPDN